MRDVLHLLSISREGVRSRMPRAKYLPDCQWCLLNRSSPEWVTMCVLNSFFRYTGSAKTPHAEKRSLLCAWIRVAFKCNEINNERQWSENLWLRCKWQQKNLVPGLTYTMWKSSVSWLFRHICSQTQLDQNHKPETHFGVSPSCEINE